MEVTEVSVSKVIPKKAARKKIFSEFLIDLSLAFQSLQPSLISKTNEHIITRGVGISSVGVFY